MATTAMAAKAKTLNGDAIMKATGSGKWKKSSENLYRGS